MFRPGDRSAKSRETILATNQARVVESIHRQHGLKLHPGQCQAGLAMLGPTIAEMGTGEGKTAASLLTIALAASSGERVFVATANDYLARRDAEFAAPVLADFQGTVGCLQSNSSLTERQVAYRAQVVYGTIKEFVFDHLRDRLAQAAAETPSRRSIAVLNQAAIRSAIQPVADRLLIDEADSILIDEAATPCIVSGPSRPYRPAVVHGLVWGSRMARELCEGIDFIDLPDQGIALTPAGRARIRQSNFPVELAELTLGELFHWLELSIETHRRFHREVDYVVKHGEVVIVDESTGRIAEGRQWSNGIHQSIEAREGLRITPASEPQALLTIQEYVRRFPHVSGMTGTAAEVRSELRSVYGLRILPVALHQPSRRSLLPTVAAVTRTESISALLAEVREMRQRGRPVLIGTRTVRASQRLSALLTDAGLPHVVLNALNPERESPIIAEAGEPERITVATNMAGRGTDIRLQGDAAAQGGLHVIGSELHPAARIDRQLMGRCGRQGDPGSFRQYLSLEDDNLIEAWGPDHATRIRQRTHSPPSIISQMRRAQQELERQSAVHRAQLCQQQHQRVELLQKLGLDPVLNPVADVS